MAIVGISDNNILRKAFAIGASTPIKSKINSFSLFEIIPNQERSYSKERVV